MDSKKLAFLKAVVGPDGADALHRAAERSSELAGAIYPRAILAWLDLVGQFDGYLPGTGCRVTFAKSEAGYDGYVTVGDGLYDFKGADLYHLAGSVAVAIGADDERIDPELTPALVGKLGKSIDVLAKSTLVREELAKTSKNVRAHTTGLPPQKKRQRIMQYIRSAGFTPYEGTQDRFGVGKDQRGLSFTANAGLPQHELAHALMTPEGETLREHQTKLGFATKQNHQGMTHDDAVAEEYAAFHMQPGIERRAGVRNTSIGYSGEAARPRGNPARDRGVAELHAFEEGRKQIDPKGRVVAGTSVDAKINARAKQLGKDEVQPKSKKRIQLPGQAAKPLAPQAPTPPTLKQPKMQVATPGAVATSPSKLSTPDVPGMGAKAAGAPQLPKVPKPPKGAGQSAKVVKSHAYTRCGICGGRQFTGTTFVGCRCFSALAKSVTVTETKTHLQLAFGDDWDADAIDALLGSLRK